MVRNFFRRNETCFPIRQKPLKKRLRKDLDLFLDDNVGAWELQGDGSYQRVVSNGNETVCAQDTLLNHLASKS